MFNTYFFLYYARVVQCSDLVGTYNCIVMEINVPAHGIRGCVSHLPAADKKDLFLAAGSQQRLICLDSHSHFGIETSKPMFRRVESVLFAGEKWYCL